MKEKYLIEKKEYFAIDVLKFIAAYMIMAIHFMPFEDINKELNFWFTQVFCRMAVPFFFVVSGYFAANKLQDGKKTIQYLKRILLMYLLYTLLYLPFMLEEYRKLGYSVFEKLTTFLKAFFIWGSYFHLWYFLALIVAVGLVYGLIHFVKLSDKQILIVTGCLYVIGTLGNAYRNLWREIPVVECLFSAYESVFQTTRNGIFMGPFLIVLGYLVRKNADKIKYRKYWLYAIGLFVLMNVEEYFARALTGHAGQSMLFVTPFVVLAIFLTACFIPVPEKLVPIGIFLRNMSVIIYGVHIFLHDKYGNELSGYAPYGFAYYLMIAKRITILAFVIVGLSRIKIFSWLKYVY